jgi:hypothetical protein
MGRRLADEEEQEKMRGISDPDLKRISDTRLIMIALARVMRSEGIKDEVLMDELLRRGRG